MNHVTIESPAADARATAGLQELGNGALLAYAAEAAEVASTAAAAELAKTAPAVDPEKTVALAALRHALHTERPRIAGLLPALAPEEIAFLLADLLSQALAASGAPAEVDCVLALAKEGSVHVLASGGGAAYVAATGSTAAIPIRRVRDGAVSFLLPGIPSSPAPGAVPPGAAVRRFHPSEVVRLPIGRESQVVLVSGGIEPTLEERLLAALQSSREPSGLDLLLRGPLERAGGALVAFAASQPEAAKDGIETEIVAFRREVERRLARLDGRLQEIENDALRAAASPRRSGFSFPGVPSLARPKPPLVRRPLPGSLEDLASADDAPAFERGLDVPVASNWSRPLLLVTGGITLILFLSLQLFCPAVPRRRVIPAPKVVPVAAPAPLKGTPATSQKPPVGVLLVTPSSEPEGTEGTAPGPSNVPPHR